MVHAHCMLDTEGYKHTLTECVIFIALELQQSLQERASMLRYTYITSHVTNEAWSFPSLSERHILTKNCSYIRITWVRSRSKSNGISSCLIHPMSLILAHQFDNISVQLRIFIHKCDNSQKYSEPITGVFRVHIHLFFPPYILLCDTKFYSALRIIRPHFTAENFNSLSSYKNSKHETNFWK